MSVSFRPAVLPFRHPAQNQVSPLRTVARQAVQQDSVRFGSDTVIPGVPAPEIPAPILNEGEQKYLLKLLKWARKVDAGKIYKPDSITNKFYQELYPRERGVIVYGSSRTKEGTPEYEYDVKVGAAIGRTLLGGKPMHVVTGGGPGAMKAIGAGATSVGAHAMGSAMNFIGEEPSTDVHPEFVIHPNFAERIDAEGGYEHRGAYTTVVPGGPGTMQEIWKKANELFYDQTKYPCQKQIILFDFEDYFSAKGGFLDNLRYMISRGKANPGMLDIFKIAKTPEEGAQMLLDDTISWTTGQIKAQEA